MPGKVLVHLFSQRSPIGRKTQGKYIMQDPSGCDVDMDELELRRFFKSTMGNRVKICPYRDRRLAEIEEILGKISEEYDMYFFVFLTFLTAGKGQSYANEMRMDCYDLPVTLEDIFECVNREPFIGKPKIFLVQADDQRILPREHTKAVGFVGGSKTHITPKAVKIPTHADRLLIMSTLPQQLTYLDALKGRGLSEKRTPISRPICSDDEPNGSFLIRAFVEVLSKPEYKEEDLASQTLWINGKVQDDITQLQQREERLKGKALTVPLVMSTLRTNVELHKYADH